MYSTAQEHRQQIIQQNIPKLIKSLTGFNENDENFGLCEAYALGRINNHRYLSVNSHEIRRRIDGLAERFMADNYTKYGEHFRELCDRLIDDPLCTGHYEYDISWILLHLLLETSKNPIGALAANKNRSRLLSDGAGHEDDQQDVHVQSERDRIMNDLISSLIRQNIPIDEGIGSQRDGPHDNDSELSDWSDDERADGRNRIASTSMSSSIVHNDPSTLKLLRSDALNPPQKPLPFIAFDATKSTAWLRNNVQHSWWRRDYQVPVCSDFDAANTCKLHQERITKLSGGLIKLPAASTASEWCLMREIIWMLQIEPDTSTAGISKFFAVDTDQMKIVLNQNVSLASVTVDGIRSILDEFAGHMTILYRVRQFLRSVFDRDNELGPHAQAAHTIECYANAIEDFMASISTFLLAKETELIQQDPMTVHSVVKLFNDWQPHMRQMEQLYAIHTRCCLDFHSHSNHVNAMHLLAALLKEIDTAATAEHLNLASSLFFASIKFYLFLFNGWWIEGRFDDWRNEFLIEKLVDIDAATLTNPTTSIYRVKSISLNDGVSEMVLETIRSCKLLQMLSDRSLEAGYIINILYNLDKLSDMRQQQLPDQTHDFYDSFLANVFGELEKFDRRLVLIDGDESPPFAEEPSVAETLSEEATVSETSKKDSFYYNFAIDSNPLLAMVFEQTIQNAIQLKRNDVTEDDSTDRNNSCRGIYKRLNEITDFHMPIVSIVFSELESLLQARIATANRYVLNIFTKEYNVLEHIYDLQKVFLLGAGDLMQTFYSNLFQCMSNNENWNNPYLLTVKLDEIIGSKYPNSQSLFSVQVGSANCHEKEPLDAINDIRINYAVRDSIQDVIHEQSLRKYNDIFRFLMQIKWAIWTLETLQFPHAYKKRRPYQPLSMIDLIFKRLALMRNWIIYSIQCIHSHLMTFVIQSMGQQLAKKMERVECLRKIIQLHDSYIETIHAHCFRRQGDSVIRNGIEQLLNLVVILNDEWNNIVALEQHGDDSIDGNVSRDVFSVNDAVTQIDSIEATYINCHCFIAETLSKAVYTKDRTELSALSAAFNCSCPY